MEAAVILLRKQLGFLSLINEGVMGFEKIGRLALVLTGAALCGLPSTNALASDPLPAAQMEQLIIG